MFDFLKHKKKVALVLGGGSARGIAHIGVLKVLQAERIPVDMVVGTSMGALIGAGYALGIPIHKMEEMAYSFTANKLMDPTIPRMGLLAGGKLELAIRGLIDNSAFTDCKIPFAAVTTNIETGEEVVHQSGDLVKSIRASCSWPGIFNPVSIGGKLLVDGGIKNSVPTKIARALGAEYVLAVDVGFCVKEGPIKNVFQILLQAFQITGEELNKYQAIDADFVIKVNLGHIDQVAFERSRESVQLGIEAAQNAMPQLRKDMRL
ncbi:MAG: patatin-like phospholipase family protein [Candidatus Omnitrophica bacterium]|nr:patatin-like phospholipase family protein [Candidatus Omnitrophota bacterium]